MFGFWRKTKLAAFQYAGALRTDVGCIRQTNEDCGALLRPQVPREEARKGILLLVCDGMGGHEAGEVASQMAVDFIGKLYFRERGDPHHALRNALERANKVIYATSRTREGAAGMGTTCAALVLHQDSAWGAHVGDSRIYLVRQGSIYRLTEDHSAVMELVKKGFLTLDQARHHEDRNVILRALGTHPQVEVSTWMEPLALQAGDRLVLSTDGLHDLLEDDEIAQLAIQGSTEEACSALVATARRRGGHDNITVGLIAVSNNPAGGRDKVPETRESEALR